MREGNYKKKKENLKMVGPVDMLIIKINLYQSASTPLFSGGS